MKYIQKIWRWMWPLTPIRMNYFFAFLVILVLYLFFPDLWSAAFPELLATFLGILIGYTLGVSSEMKLRKFDEDKRKDLENTQLKKKQEYLLNVLDEEIIENLGELDKLEKVNNYTIPETFLRTSSWYTVQKYIDAIEDFEFIENIFELYFKIEEMNKNIDYLRQHIFFGVVVSPSEDKSRRFLSNAIRINTTTLKRKCTDVSDLIDLEKAKLRKDLET